MVLILNTSIYYLHALQMFACCDYVEQQCPESVKTLVLFIYNAILGILCLYFLISHLYRLDWSETIKTTLKTANTQS